MFASSAGDGMSEHDLYGAPRRPSFPPGVRVALGGVVVMVLLNLLNLFVFRLPLVALYPAQLIAYFVVGRVAAGMARNEDPYGGMQTGMPTDINFAAVR